MTIRDVVVVLLRAYKGFVSPLFPPACRFHPTCSEYAAEAVEIHGVFRGIVLAAWRLLRCNPWCQSGFDPVPDAFRLADPPATRVVSQNWLAAPRPPRRPTCEARRERIPGGSDRGATKQVGMQRRPNAEPFLRHDTSRGKSA